MYTEDDKALLGIHLPISEPLINLQRIYWQATTDLLVLRFRKRWPNLVVDSTFINLGAGNCRWQRTTTVRTAVDTMLFICRSPRGQWSRVDVMTLVFYSGLVEYEWSEWHKPWVGWSVLYVCSSFSGNHCIAIPMTSQQSRTTSWMGLKWPSGSWGGAKTGRGETQFISN